MTVEQIETRLSRARDALERATSVSDAANKHAQHVTPGRLADGTYDSAVLSGIRRKPNPKAAARTFNAYSRAAEAQRQLDTLRNNVRVLEIQLAKAIEDRERVRFTREDFAGAALVRDQYGWHKVAKINPSTVAVETGYSWTDRIPFDKVLQIHRPDTTSHSARTTAD